MQSHTQDTNQRDFPWPLGPSARLRVAHCQAVQLYGVLDDVMLTDLFGLPRVTLRAPLGARRVLLLETWPSFDDRLLVLLVHEADGSYRAALAPSRWSFHRRAQFALGPTPVPSPVAEPAFALHPCPVPYHANPYVVDGISYALRVEDAAAVASCELSNPRADEPCAGVVKALLGLAERVVQEQGNEAARELVAVWRRYENQLTADEPRPRLREDNARERADR